jgi:hypothetical protein
MKNRRRGGLLYQRISPGTGATKGKTPLWKWQRGRKEGRRVQKGI